MGEAIGIQPLAGMPGVGLGSGYAVIGMPGKEVQGRVVGIGGNISEEGFKER